MIKRLSEGRRDGVAVIAEGVVLDIAEEDLEGLQDVERDSHGHLRIAEVNLGEILKSQVHARLKALAPFGRLVTYGLASREPNQVSNGTLMRKSQAVVGFWLAHCLGRPEMVGEPLQDLFERVARGELRAVVGETYPLSEARRAHEDMQARRTSGKLLLDPAA